MIQSRVKLTPNEVRSLLRGHPTSTQSGRGIGTELYLSPRQVRQHRAGHKIKLSDDQIRYHLHHGGSIWKTGWNYLKRLASQIYDMLTQNHIDRVESAPPPAAIVPPSYSAPPLPTSVPQLAFPSAPPPPPAPYQPPRDETDQNIDFFNEGLSYFDDEENLDKLWQQAQITFANRPDVLKRLYPQWLRKIETVRPRPPLPPFHPQPPPVPPYIPPKPLVPLVEAAVSGSELRGPPPPPDWLDIPIANEEPPPAPPMTAPIEFQSSSSMDRTLLDAIQNVNKETYLKKAPRQEKERNSNEQFLNKAVGQFRERLEKQKGQPLEKSESRKNLKGEKKSEDDWET